MFREVSLNIERSSEILTGHYLLELDPCTNLVPSNVPRQWERKGKAEHERGCSS